MTTLWSKLALALAIAGLTACGAPQQSANDSGSAAMVEEESSPADVAAPSQMREDSLDDED